MHHRRSRARSGLLPALVAACLVSGVLAATEAGAAEARAARPASGALALGAPLGGPVAAARRATVRTTYRLAAARATAVYRSAPCTVTTTSGYGARGLRMINACPVRSGEEVVAQFDFTGLPSRSRVVRAFLQVYGHTYPHPGQTSQAHLIVSIRTTAARGWTTQTRSIRTTRPTTRWRTVAVVRGATHVIARRLTARVALDDVVVSPNDLDLKAVRLVLEVRARR